MLSSWSAGYGAVAHVLPRHDPRIEAVVLLDSLYAGYTDVARRVLDRARLAPFLDAARAARAGGPALFLTHTAIATPGYGSTGEVASFLLAELGASAAPVDEEPSASSPYPLRSALRGRPPLDPRLRRRRSRRALRAAPPPAHHPARHHPPRAALKRATCRGACPPSASTTTIRASSASTRASSPTPRGNGAPSVVLDRTAFYPESGGQMADRGELAGHRVVDVQVDDDGAVHHVLEGGALPAIGEARLRRRRGRPPPRPHGAAHGPAHALARPRRRRRRRRPSRRASGRAPAPSTSIASPSTSAASPRPRTW